MKRLRVEGQRGALLVEAMIALTVSTIGLLGILVVFQANFRTGRDVGTQDQAHIALENAVEALQTADFATLYDTYNGVDLPTQGLVGPGGTPATVRVEFDINELSLPAEYGPVPDIDGDKVLSTPDASDNYILLPARLRLDYQMSYGSETRTMFFVLRAPE